MHDYKTLSGIRFKKQAVMAVLFLFIIIGGWIYPAIGYLVPLCMLLGIGFGITQGRKWCDFYCPRGSFFDTACKAISPQKKIPSILRTKTFRIFVLIVLAAMMSVQVVRRWPDFLNIGSFFIMLLTGVTIAGIILSLIFHQRTWCSFCPVGSLSSWFSRKTSSLKIDSSLCNECRICARVCPIQITPYKFKSEGLQPVEDRDCLKCGFCAAACPKNALTR